MAQPFVVCKQTNIIGKIGEGPSRVDERRSGSVSCGGQDRQPGLVLVRETRDVVLEIGEGPVICIEQINARYNRSWVSFAMHAPAIQE